MKTIKNILLLCAVALSATASCNASTQVKPSDPRIAYVGRVSLSNPEKAVFTWPGIQLHFNFSGTSAKMATKPGSGYFMVEVDDLEPVKVHSGKTDSIITL
ncbi:MAG: lipase, partial [Muribaculaceae bacterium]|nr:lipase [Muribaculaceae bacterium]